MALPCGHVADGLVSVIMPVYDRQDTIRRAIDSVLCQTYADLELIVVDDGSTDDTVDIVRAYTDRRIRLICQKENGGANKARNVGIANAEGDYIAFQDSDDEWMADKLATQIRTMEESGYLACYSAYDLCQGSSIYTVPSGFYDRDRYEAGLSGILARYNVVDTPTLIMKRQALTLLGNEYFDEALGRLQDYEFVIRLHRVCPLAYVPRPLVRAYRTEGSITADSSALYAAAGRIIEKHGDLLDMEGFMGALITAEAGISAPQKLLADLKLLQARTGLGDAGCKDKMFSYICRRLDIWNGLASRQYQAAVSALQDRRFSIYGAGAVGHEVYHSLLKKGLRPACFLVTRYDGDEVVDDIPVVSIDDHQDREDMVIISISAEHQIELMDNLIARHYRQFCVYQRETG